MAELRVRLPVDAWVGQRPFVPRSVSLFPLKIPSERKHQKEGPADQQEQASVGYLKPTASGYGGYTVKAELGVRLPVDALVERRRVFFGTVCLFSLNIPSQRKYQKEDRRASVGYRKPISFYSRSNFEAKKVPELRQKSIGEVLETHSQWIRPLYWDKAELGV
ncbi:hypothetical protein B0H17DRAFT_1183956 [Mycena rosella]|uniref:Uncharacterized protein n=1 Tax=Mycena rosella TaxID=1033263 RepID=A0AAD7CXT7_MYCRO|nr:hypothetical protein B0H17DRAFT_1183956 [Mycena rosella]